MKGMNQLFNPKSKVLKNKADIINFAEVRECLVCASLARADRMLVQVNLFQTFLKPKTSKTVYISVPRLTAKAITYFVYFSLLL